MAIQVQTWQAKDGSTFESEREADRHDAKCLLLARVEDWAGALPEENARERSRKASAAELFVRWLCDNGTGKEVLVLGPDCVGLVASPPEALADVSVTLDDIMAALDAASKDPAFTSTASSTSYGTTVGATPIDPPGLEGIDPTYDPGPGLPPDQRPAAIIDDDPPPGDSETDGTWSSSRPIRA